MLQILEAGAADFLLKPFQPMELFARLRGRYQLCQMRRELIARENLSARRDGS